MLQPWSGKCKTLLFKLTSSQCLLFAMSSANLPHTLLLFFFFFFLFKTYYWSIVDIEIIFCDVICSTMSFQTFSKYMICSQVSLVHLLFFLILGQNFQSCNTASYYWVQLGFFIQHISYSPPSENWSSINTLYSLKSSIHV